MVYPTPDLLDNKEKTDFFNVFKTALLTTVHNNNMDALCFKYTGPVGIASVGVKSLILNFD